jgi:YidC/Oxa1 family membrane protein insertase
MSRLKPKLDAIKEKYKDAKKQQEATMKVMREEKVSLLPGGCLLAFLQMPIWISLYGVLQTTFEMRHASFLWVQDLTAPDHLVHLPFFQGVWLLPEWFNLLPILMMATWYASAAMQPLPTDPQQAQQAKMMRWMPVAMGFFLYGTAAGLTLYMTMSAIWSIGETWLIRKIWLSKLENALK